MTFTPKIVHDDEALRPEPLVGDQDDVELPAELSALAGQLAQEAAWLAGRYPAAGGNSPAKVELPTPAAAPPTTSPGTGHDRQGRRGPLVGAAMAVLLAMLGGAAVLHFRSAGDLAPQESVPANMVRATSPPPHHVGPLQSPPTLAAEFPQEIDMTGADSADEASTITTPVFVHELTGPELEGLLDLLEQDQAANSRLSI